MNTSLTLHFQDDGLGCPTTKLERWEIRWYSPQNELVARRSLLPRNQARQMEGFLWHRPVASLCVGVLRLAVRDHQKRKPLMVGGRGTAAGMLADYYYKGINVSSFRCLLEHSDQEDRYGPLMRLRGWFHVTNGAFRNSRPVKIFVGPLPPAKIHILRNGEQLEPQGMEMLALVLEQWVYDQGSGNEV